jgi:hypothetical protein
MNDYANSLTALIDRLHVRCSTAPCDEEQEIVSKAAILLGFECPVQYPDLWNALGAHAYESAAYRLLPDWDEINMDRLTDGTFSVTVFRTDGHDEGGQAATLALALTEAALAHKLSTIEVVA